METYSDSNANDARFGAARELVNVEARDDLDRMATEVVLDLKDGRRLEGAFDAGVAATDLEAQAEKLTAKFRSLSAPVVGKQRTQAIVDAVAGLERAANVEGLMAAV